MPFDGLADRVVVITGATGNLGSACAQVFCNVGAHCVLLDRSTERLDQRFGSWGNQHLLSGNVDLTNLQAVGAVATATLTRFGRVDALVHTVGAFQGGKPAYAAPAEEWELLLAVNLRTAVNMIHAFVPPMVERQFGRVVVVGARPGLQGKAHYAAYSASKAALLRVIESLAAEVREQGVTANSVLPGTMDTPQNRAAMPNADFSKWVPPARVAQTIAFLISDAGRDISGAAIPIYGRS